MGRACSSRVAATCAALAALAVSTPARAQESDARGPAPSPSGDVLELQFGAGYLFREGDLAFLPSVEMGVVLWWHESWGLSLRRSATIGEHMASYDYGDGMRTGGRSFRHWTGTLRFRRALGSTLELNLGAGLTFGAYDHLTWRPGAARSSPEVWTQGGFRGILGEVLVGSWIAPRWGVKAGLVSYLVLDEAPAVVPVAFGVMSF